MTTNNKSIIQVFIRIIYLFLAVLMIFLIVRSMFYFVYGTFFANIPGEYRDVANVMFTQDILDGNNPYVFKAEPIDNYIYAYTPINSLLAAIISKVIGISAFRSHYILTLLFLVLSAAAISYYIYKKTNNKIMMLTSFMMALELIQRGNSVSISAVPDMTALFISLIMFIMLDLGENITYVKLAVLIGLSVILFYIKQYFVFLALPVMIYLLWDNYKKAIIYIAGCAVIGLISLYIINIFCPLFTVDTIYSFLNSAGEADALKDSGYAYSFRQMKMIFIYYMPAGVLFIAFFVKKIVSSKVDNKGYKAVITSLRFDIWQINTVVMFLVLFFFLGKHDGAYLSYHLQLMVPSLIVAAFVGAHEELCKSKNNITVYYIAGAACILWCCLTHYRMGHAPYYTEEELERWDRAYSIMNEYSADEILALTPCIGYYSLERNIMLVDNGHDYIQEMESGINKSLVIICLEKLGLMDHMDEYYNMALTRRDEILTGISSNDYKLIVLPEGGGGCPYFSVDNPDYYLVETLALSTGHEQYNMSFYAVNDI